MNNNESGLACSVCWLTLDERRDALNAIIPRSEAVACTKTKKKWGLQGYGSAESLHLPCTGRAALTDPR